MQSGKILYSNHSKITRLFSKKVLLWTATVLFTFGTFLALYQSVHPDPWHVHTTWDKLIYPQESNAFLRQPSIGGAITDIAVVDDHIWLVGGGGLILHSSDNGRCWKPQGPWVTVQGEVCPEQKTGLGRIISRLTAALEPKNVLDELVPAAYAADSKSNKEIYQFEEQGRVVYPPQAFEPEPPINPSRALPANNINRSTIAKKVPLSKQTKADTIKVAINKDKVKKTDTVPKYVIPNFRAVAFVDKQKGVAVGIRGVIYYTKNGGTSWTAANSGTDQSLVSVAINDNKQALAVGNDGIILRSSDAGVNWLSVESGTDQGLLSVAINDNKQALTVGRGGIILRSSDAGVNWLPVESGTDQGLLSVAINDNKQALAVGDNGIMLRSSDAGINWLRVDSRTGKWYESLQSVAINENNQVLVVGSRGVILSSSDGGINWVPVESGTDQGLLSVAINGNKQALVVGYNGTILRSSDAGVNWSPGNSVTNQERTTVAINDNNQALAVGSQGTMLRSSDGGINWVPVESGTDQGLLSVAINDNKQALTVGRGGIILRSSDAGVNWLPVESGTDQGLLSVAINDNKQALAVGDNGIMLRSSDAGVNWSPVEIRNTQSLVSVAINDNNQALAVGYNGTILRSSDAGVNWLPGKSVTNQERITVAINDNNQALAIGSQGTMLHSSDGGINWVPVESGTGQGRITVVINDNNQALAVGSQGTILRSSDGGVNWMQVESGVSARFHSVAMIDNNALAVGANGIILRSTDNGNSWDQVDNYSVSLANWWYLILLTSIGLALFALWPRLQQVKDDGIAEMAASDRPLQPGEPDALNLGELANDIAEFISNPNTTAPLTMAITGPWGSGKSSLMNLIQYSLKHKGFSPVWFNAWHHQKGEQLLASLFAHIKQQAIPSLLSFDGLVFRVRLAVIRGLQHWFVFAILLSLLCLTLALNKQAIGGLLTTLALLSDPENWWQVWESWKINFSIFTPEGDTLQILASLFGIGTPVLALIRSFRGFGLNPKKLVSIDHRSDSQKGYDPGARARFAKEFSDVTSALGDNKMVIFIDDLDRCTQENLIDILENINFISSSGDCFLVLGMAPRYVEACVANAYETLAKNIAEKDRYDNQATNNLTNNIKEKHKFDFAHNYLEKMINIEVAVPGMQNNTIENLLKQKPEASNFWLSLLNVTPLVTQKLSNVIIPGLIVLLAIGAGLKYGKDIPPQPIVEPNPVYDLQAANMDTIVSLSQGDLLVKLKKKQLDEKISGDKVDVLKGFSISLQAKKIQLEKGIKIGSLGQGNNKADVLLKLDEKVDKDKKAALTKKKDAPVVKPEASSGTRAQFRQAKAEAEPRLSAVRLLIGILVMLFIVLYLYNKKKQKYAQDSDDFKQALSTWTAWIRLKRETPRAIKRFLNHLRFLAIRNDNVIQESVLVAMASIYFYNKQWLLDDEKFALLVNKKLEKLLLEDYETIGSTTIQEEQLQEITKPLYMALDTLDYDNLQANRVKAISVIERVLHASYQ